VTFGFGEKWRSAAAIIAAYGLIAAFRQVGFNYSIFQRAVNDTRPMFISAVINLLAFALVGVPCILIFGLAGFPIGFGAMTAIQIGVRGYFMSKLFAGFQMWRHLLRAMAPSVPAAAVVLLARAIAPGERSLAHALFELALYIVATLAATAFFERRLMREMTSYVTGRRSGRDLLTGDDGELLDGGGGAEPGTAASAEAPRRRDPMLKWVGCAVAVAFVLRLGMVGVATDWPVVFDPADYARHALAIAHTGHYPDTSVAPGGGPTALRPPAWPYALGAVFAVTGDNVGAARVLQAGLGTAAVALMALIAWQLFGPRASLFAAIVGAVYPPWLLLDASLFSEPLFMVFELGAVAAVLHARGSPRRWAWLALTGVLLGLAVLTRSNGVLLALPLALLAWPGRREGSWRALAAPALIVLCAALTVAPWTVRNAVVMNAFVPVSTQSGYTLAGAYNDASRNDRREPATWRVATADPAYARLLAGSPREVELNGRLGSRAKSYISDHPGYVAKVLFWNVRRFLHLGRFEFARHSYSAYGASRTAADIAIFSFYPVLLLALAGLVLPASRRAPLALWLVPLLMCTPLFIEANIRFRAPVEPFVLMLAGIALAAASQRTARFRRLATLRSGGSPEAVRAGPT
jgi:4-amino-4-deoxy-L-arabinose transferase-like glycosyltransferase